MQKPGLFAPKGEKELYKAINAQDVHAIRRIPDEHPDFRLAAYSLSGLMLLQDDTGEVDQALARGPSGASS